MSTNVSNAPAPLPPSGQPAVVPGEPVGGAGPTTPGLGVVGGGGGALVTGSGAGAPNTLPAGVDPAYAAALQQAIRAVIELIGAMTAQQQGAGVIGGGGLLTGVGTALETGTTAGAPSLGVIGGGGAISGGLSIASPGGTGTGVVGGGGTSGGMSITPGAPVGSMSITSGAPAGGMSITPGAPVGTMTITPSPSQPAAVQPAAAGAQPVQPAVAGATGAPATVGGGSTEPVGTDFVDTRYLTGTPQAGGIIDVLLRARSGTAPDAKSEGVWMNVQDAGGATLMVHVHGARYVQDPSAIIPAIQQGAVAVHTHPDGLIHIHDIR